MGWETRLDHYRYFVVSVRRGGRVIHFTFKGQAAEIAVWEAESRREARQKAIAARREYRELRGHAQARLGRRRRWPSLVGFRVTFAGRGGRNGTRPRSLELYWMDLLQYQIASTSAEGELPQSRPLRIGGRTSPNGTRRRR
jgi:hypothetical protein